MKVIFVLASLLLLKPATAVANPLTDSVIINNFVFDSSGSPWLGDWVIETAGISDTASFFLPGAPPGSTAKWSLLFIPYEDAVSRTFTHLSSGIYQLSCWAKSIEGGEGSAWFIQDDSTIVTIVLGTFTDSTHRSLDTNWIQYFLTDTLSLTSSDTFQIILAGESSPLGPGVTKSLINNISFVKLLPSGGVGAAPNLSANLRVFPNPASGELQIMGAQSGEIHLFDLMGRDLMSAVTDGSGTTLDVSTLPSGMYFVSDGHSEIKFVKE